MDMPYDFVQQFPHSMLGYLRPTQGFGYLVREKIEESLRYHQEDPDWAGPGVVIFDQNLVNIPNPRHYALRFKSHPGRHYDALEELAQDHGIFIVQGLHRTISAFESGVSKSFFVLSRQDHLNYIIDVLKGNTATPHGWDYNANRLRFFPPEVPFDKITYDDVLEWAQQEHQLSIGSSELDDGYVLEEFVQEYWERFQGNGIEIERPPHETYDYDFNEDEWDI